jgi:hypothetical protein
MVRPRGAVADLDRAGANVMHRLSAEGIEVTYAKEGARRHFVVRRKSPLTVFLAPLLDARREWLAERPGRFVVGVTPDGRILTASLADPSTPHLLVARQAGSGSRGCSSPSWRASSTGTRRPPSTSPCSTPSASPSTRAAS